MRLLGLSTNSGLHYVQYTSLCATLPNRQLTLCGVQSFAQLLQAPQEEADAIIKERFPVPRLVVCDQYGSQVISFIFYILFVSLPQLVWDLKALLLLSIFCLFFVRFQHTCILL